jgi:hypothetical protein
MCDKAEGGRKREWTLMMMKVGRQTNKTNVKTKEYK